MRFIALVFASLIIIAVLMLMSYAFGAGQNLDSVALVEAARHETTLDEIQELREIEKGGFPYGLVCGTILIFLFALGLMNMQHINKTLRSSNAMLKTLGLGPKRKRPSYRRTTQPTSPAPQHAPHYQPTLPSSQATAHQLPGGEGHEEEHDF